MSTVELPRPPKFRSILVLEKRTSMHQLRQVAAALDEAFKQDKWPIILAAEGPAYWLPVRDEAHELLAAAFAYIERHVSPEEAKIDGFDVDAWCEAVERLGLSEPPEGENS